MMMMMMAVMMVIMMVMDLGKGPFIFAVDWALKKSNAYLSIHKSGLSKIRNSRSYNLYNRRINILLYMTVIIDLGKVHASGL